MKTFTLSVLPVLSVIMLTACGRSGLTNALSGNTESGTNALPLAATNIATTGHLYGSPAPKAPEDLAGVARELIILAHGQMGDGVLTNFIAGIQQPFHLDADQIVYLRDVGLSPAIIECLLIRQQQLGPMPDESKTETGESSPNTAGPTLVSPFNAPAVPTSTTPPTPASTSSPSDAAALAPPQVGAAQPAETPPAVNNYNFFYDSLAPYGNWVTVPNYGYVWQPSCAVVTPGWRPYWNNGSWIWSDSGWYWNSYYSWGWAPFHYGNWCNTPGYGWCWAPGNVWGPSWVTFRYTSGYCGWAPLPPGCGWQSGMGLTFAGGGVGLSFGFGYGAGNYCWTPTSYFAAPHCANYGVVGIAGQGYFNNSSVINNYVVGNNNTIINGGIDPGQIQKYSRNEVRKVQLADANSPSTARSAFSTANRPGQGTQLAVYRPAVSSGSGAAPTLVSTRTEARSISSSPLSSSTPTGSRSPLPQRTVSGGTSSTGQQAGPARIEIPAGSPNPRGSAVQLQGSPRGVTQSQGQAPRVVQGGARSATSTPSPLTGRPGAVNPSAPSQGLPASGSSTVSRLEPRKDVSNGAAAGSNPSPSEQAGYVRTPSTSGSYARPSGSIGGPARIPPAVQNNYSARQQFNGSPGMATGGYTRPPMASPQQAPRASFSAPISVPAPVSRPQYPTGGGMNSPTGRPGRTAP